MSDLPWGFIDETGQFQELPMKPMLDAGLGPPPFTVQIWSGGRTVIYRPYETVPAISGHEGVSAELAD